jgi:hypothetical protein
MKIFLAFAFRDDDKSLVSHIDQLLASQSVQVVTGQGLGGEQLTPAVQQRIDACDGLVALLTRRDPLANNAWTTHQWVRDELAYARNAKKKGTALLETGVENAGMYQPHEFIPLDRGDLIPALLRLSDCIGLWKLELGRTVKVQLGPPALAKKAGNGAAGLTCSYRLWIQGKFTPWEQVTPVPEGGGTFVYVPGVQDEHLIQIRIDEKGKVWQSLAASQWLNVKLTAGGK